jgi:hypothetical protein
MMAFLFQILALVFLLTGIGVGYWIWVRPLGRLNLPQTGALLLTLVALVGGIGGSLVWWFDAPFSFAWDLPPLASRMLASAGVSFFVLCLIALQRPTFGRLRLVMLCLFLYLVPLAAAIFLFHLDRFDLSASITYGFFVIAVGMAAASTGYLLRPVRVIPDTSQEQEPTRPGVKTWLLAVAVLTGLWGMALFVTDQGPSDLVWVWPGDLLSSRLIGVMLLTIAGGSLYSLRRADLARAMLAMTITYSLGLAAASLWNILSARPVKPAYIVVFALIFLGSALSLAAERSRGKMQAAGTPVQQRS